MKARLARIRKPWHRLLIGVAITLMLSLEHRMSKHLRAHWVGWRAPKPKRLAFYIFAAIIIAGHIISNTPMLWAIAWGAAFSIFVICQSFTIIARRLGPAANIT